MKFSVTKRAKLAAITIIDWFDDVILHHRFHPRLCTWIATHPWWGDEP